MSVCLCCADGCAGQDADLLVLSKEGLRVKYVIAKGQVRHSRCSSHARTHGKRCFDRMAVRLTCRFHASQVVKRPGWVKKGMFE